MDRQGFVSWLKENGYKQNVVNTRAGNCETVCTYEGDLDVLFEKDECKDLLNRLCYSTDDERNNRPTKHKIPINGNKRTGSATLKQAVTLYVKFRKNKSITVKNVLQSGCSIGSVRKGDWPDWETPNEEEVYQLAQIITKYVRFLSPAIIGDIVDFNEQIKEKIRDHLEKKGINPDLYLWEKSSCCFPGVRRFAGSSEISAYRKRSEISAINDALLLDDNDFPKQVWSFVFRGQQFSKFGPNEYSLAHLIDHKKDKNRMEKEFIFPTGYKFEKPFYGLYTCASNSVYIPSNIMKPTDFNGQIRNLLFRKAYELYGDICNIIPAFIKIPAPDDEKWELNRFKWAEPVGSVDNVYDFNLFRIEKIAKFLLGN